MTSSTEKQIITHIAQYLKKKMQSDNKIGSVNRIQRKKNISSKIMQKMW